jgi:hypothetical protein
MAAGGTRIADVLRKGAKLITIDPVYTRLAQKSHIWLPVRTGMDIALLLAWLNIIINEDLYDKEFVEKWFNPVRMLGADEALITKTLTFIVIKEGPLFAEEARTGVLLPDGREFISWERPVQFTRTYYVDNGNPHAADSNPGTQELPFLTINRAAQVLQPGERVVIMTGVYRERVDPVRGGAGPDKMISYEAAPGARWWWKGSRLIKKGWESSTGFRLGWGEEKTQAKVFQLSLESMPLDNYNPFAMVIRSGTTPQ